MSKAPNHYYKWVVVGVVWLIAGLNYTDRMTIFSVLPVLKREMGFSDIALALLGSTFLWSYAICSPIGGYLGDRLSRRRVILGSLLIFSLVTFATGLARTANQMIFLRCLLGLSEAVFLPPALAYIASFHDNRTRSLANSIALTGLTAGTGFGSWYGGFMSDHYSWRMGFFLLGIVGIVVAGTSLVILRKDTVAISEGNVGNSEPFVQKVSGVLNTATARSLIFLAFALSLTSWPTHSWLPMYLFEKFSLTLTRAGSTITLYAALPALVGGIVGGILADRWSAHDVRGRMAVQVIGFAVMAPAMLAIGFMGSAHTVAADLLIYSVARGMLECNSMPIFCSVIPSYRWSMAYGIYNFAGTLAGSLGIFFIGMQKSTWGIGYTLSAMSVLLFIALVVIAFTMFRNLGADVQRQRESPGLEPSPQGAL
ncbi:MAG TPA: MFS transporter [Terriglobales bacterium]|jgi:MFS family permease|nr:MFS transporter [Terriglobales bacterium]